MAPAAEKGFETVKSKKPENAVGRGQRLSTPTRMLAQATRVTLNSSRMPHPRLTLVARLPPRVNLEPSVTLLPNQGARGKAKASLLRLLKPLQLRRVPSPSSRLTSQLSGGVRRPATTRRKVASPRLRRNPLVPSPNVLMPLKTRTILPPKAPRVVRGHPVPTSPRGPLNSRPTAQPGGLGIFPLTLSKVIHMVVTSAKIAVTTANVTASSLNSLFTRLSSVKRGRSTTIYGRTFASSPEAEVFTSARCVLTTSSC